MTPDADSAQLRTPRVLVLALVVLPILLNAIALFPEVRNSTPADNDQIFHYLFIERANQALAAGDNPLDHWLPELEGGFPQFLYYQNLPHLTVVALHHLVFEQISLLRMLNLVRYLLMVLFPLTVFWSMRQMGFSMIAAAVGAAFSSTLSSRLEYGFDYRSYVWNGAGMFPQLCSMHLMFIGAACLHRVFERSKGFAAAIIASSAMVLSDLLYGYIFAVAALILWLLSVWKRVAKVARWSKSVGGVSRLTVRFITVGFTALVITAYQTVPFLHQVQYINREGAGAVQHGAIGVSGVLVDFFGGHLFDNQRLPIVTVMVFIGIVYAAVTRRDEAKIALTVFVVFLLLAFGRDILGPVFSLLPLSHLVPFRRFVAGGDFGAIMLIGLAGEFISAWWPWDFRGTRTVASVALLLILLAVTLAERWTFYAPVGPQMEISAEALENDSELAEVFSALRAGAPGRVYAGSRGNWGQWMDVGGIHLYDLLPFERFVTVMPWQSLSLNTPYLWRMNVPSEELCQLFNIRYIVAPPIIKFPRSFHRIVTTSRYVLYEVDSGGYMQLGRVAEVAPMSSSSKLFARNSDWLASDQPTEARFIAYLSPRQKLPADLTATANDNTAHPGTIENEKITPDSLSANVSITSPALMVFKTTYHPNWHVLVDGQEQPAFMVSPSFIGTMIAPGKHQVTAEYRSSMLKKLLLVLSCVTLLATLAVWAFGLEQFLFRRFAD